MGKNGASFNIMPEKNPRLNGIRTRDRNALLDQLSGAGQRA